MSLLITVFKGPFAQIWFALVQ